ncbi:MAG: glycosyltransferase [Sulfurovum sp.]|nr:glycosyltransferase [Sulfurovum sp.]
MESPLFSVLLGWVTIKIKMTSDTFMAPKIVIDYEEEYAHNSTVMMNQIDDDSYQVDILILSKPRRIAFYPSNQCNTFEIQSFKMRSCSDFLHVYYQHLVVIHHDCMRLKNPFRLHIKSYKRYKKKGMLGMLDGLEDEYRKLQPYGIKRVTTLKTRYEKWIKENEKFSNVNAQISHLSYQPLISIVMPTYNTPIQYLKKAIDSVIGQSYRHWELCIADDASPNPKMLEMLRSYGEKYDNIKVIFRKENGHISLASNTALSLATGEFVAFLDHDDMLASHALLEVVSVINSRENIQFIYSDEDKIDVRGKRFEPHFKSGWNPDMFYSHNYISHFSVMRRQLVEEVGGLRVGYEGAQDYDLLLRVLDGLNEEEIAHIPKILYHWRAMPGSSALDAGYKPYSSDAGYKALSDFFGKKDTKIRVEKAKIPNTYKISYPLPTVQPLVSIIVPTRDNYEILFTCIESILSHTSYSNYEIIIVDNESTLT